MTRLPNTQRLLRKRSRARAIAATKRLARNASPMNPAGRVLELMVELIEELA